MARQVKRAPDGGKQWQGNGEDRDFEYRKWRLDALRGDRNFGFSTDADQFEWRFVNDQKEIVALIELTRPDKGKTIFAPRSYCETIWNRYYVEEHQAWHSRYIANKIGCMAYVVVYEPDLSTFYVHNLLKEGADTNPFQWKRMAQHNYIEFLRSLSKIYEINKTKGIITPN